MKVFVNYFGIIKSSHLSLLNFVHYFKSMRTEPNSACVIVRESVTWYGYHSTTWQLHFPSCGLWSDNGVSSISSLFRHTVTWVLRYFISLIDGLLPQRTARDQNPFVITLIFVYKTIFVYGLYKFNDCLTFSRGSVVRLV